jgi:outer membrane protein
MLLCGPILSNEKIVFIDIDKIIYQSDLGKKLNKKIANDIKKEDSALKKREKELKQKENDILKQKNILSKDELNNKISSLKTEINNFKEKRRSTNKKFADIRLKQTNSMVMSLNQILSNFANEKSISLIIQKKNIVIGKSALDITDQILDIFNKEVKSLKN